MRNLEIYPPNHLLYLPSLKKLTINLVTGELSDVKTYTTPFVRQLTALLEVSYADESFDTSVMCRKLCLCRMQVHRKVKKNIGLIPAKCILYFRLAKAMLLLSNSVHTIGEIACQTGFGSPNNFSRAFRRVFGMTPSQSRQQVINRLKKVNSGLDR